MTIDTNRNTHPNTDVADWWQTDIIDMAPGKIHFRGQPIEQLIASKGLVEMIWLMLREDRPPNDWEIRLLNAALVAGVDHGPQAPSIATARMAITCGLGLNNAMASAINLLGDVHGGAGEQAVQLFLSVKMLLEQKPNLKSDRQSLSDAEPEYLAQACQTAIVDWQQQHGQYLPGFGHRFHRPTDPRVAPLLDLLQQAEQAGAIIGDFSRIALALSKQLNTSRTTPLGLNIDGITAVVYAELGFAAPLARGLFCLSRSIGILAHAWEQKQQGGRNKGPTPPHYRWTYTGKVYGETINREQANSTELASDSNQYSEKP